MKVLTYGTFDVFHYGHWLLLKRAKELGDYLIVGVSTDEFAKSKGKVPFFSTTKRMEMVRSLRFVDEVIPENSMQQKVQDVKEKRIDIFVLGSDYRETFLQMPEYQQLIDLGCKVIFLERTPAISSSDLKKKLSEQLDVDKKKG